MKSLGDVLMLSAALALFVFPPAYHFTSGGLWRYSRVGRGLMSFMVALDAVMVLAVLNLILDPLPEVVRPIVWLVVSFVAWRQVWLLFAKRYDLSLRGLGRRARQRFRRLRRRAGV